MKRKTTAICDEALADDFDFYACVPTDQDFDTILTYIDSHEQYKQNKNADVKKVAIPELLAMAVARNPQKLVRYFLVSTLLGYSEYKTALKAPMRRIFSKDDMTAILNFVSKEAGRFNGRLHIYTARLDDIKKKYEAEAGAGDAQGEPKAESLQEPLSEARLDWSVQYDKMKKWHEGTRGLNIAQCGDQKLYVNWKICRDNGWKEEAEQLWQEATRRGLPWGNQAYNNNSTEQQRSSTSFVPMDFQPVDIANVFDHYDENDPMATINDLFSDVDGFNGFIQGYKNVVHTLIIALATGKAALAKNLAKKFSEIANVPIAEIQQAVSSAVKDKAIQTRLAELIRDYPNGTPVDEALEENIEKHDTLNEKLWTEDEELKPEVAEKINMMADEFLKMLKKDDIDIKVKDIVIIGSNCSYNYTENSDLDVHIITDTKSLKDPSELYPALYSAYRKLFEKKFDVEFYGIPVELYVETEGLPTVSNGCYSVKNMKWIKEPALKDIPDFDQEAFDKEFAEWEAKYDELIASIGADDAYLTEELKSADLDKVNKFIDEIYALRKKGLSDDGEYGTGNLIFKEFRNKGYLDNLKSLKNAIIGKELSLADENQAEAENEPETAEFAEEDDAEDDLAFATEQLSRISGKPVAITESGRFDIYGLHESDVQRVLEQVRVLPYVSYARKTIQNTVINTISEGMMPPTNSYNIFGHVNLGK